VPHPKDENLHMNWQFLRELEDLDWFPRIFRNQITDALQFFTTEMKVYDPIIPELLWVLQQSKTKKVVDLCSGGSGPWEYLLAASTDIHSSVEKITLTDLYPNEESFKKIASIQPKVDFEKKPVSALNVDETLEGVRTLYSCLHHFTTREATSILQDAVDKQMPICVFEFTGRKGVNFFHTPIATAVLFIRLFFKRPLTIQKFFFSYLLPIVPVIYLWDSTVSHLRSFSQDELQAMVTKLKNGDSYQWEIGEKGSPRSHLRNTFLIGYPKR
jgi:hypothetical protein